MDFAKYDCDNLYQKFIQLWAVPSHTILLTATRQGSVIGSFFIADSTDGSSVAARFAALETALANPTSPESTFANSNGIPVLRATAVGGSGVPIGLVIGAAVGGIVLIVALILLIVFCVRRNKGRRSDTKYTVSNYFALFSLRLPLIFFPSSLCFKWTAAAGATTSLARPLT